MKTKFVKCYGCSYYLKFIKKHWWSHWEVEKIGLLPVLYSYASGANEMFKRWE